MRGRVTLFVCCLAALALMPFVGASDAQDSAELRHQGTEMLLLVIGADIGTAEYERYLLPVAFQAMPVTGASTPAPATHNSAAGVSPSRLYQCSKCRPAVKL